jgi:hypothetical protein
MTTRSERLLVVAAITLGIPWMCFVCTVVALNSYLFVRVFVSPALDGSADNDFKVVDALRIGMTRNEASATIAAFSFHLEQSADRPSAGWPESDRTFTDLPGRARTEEVRLGRRINVAECYPVSHGLLGFGELFLFYGDDGRLAHFYRRQIN